MADESSEWRRRADDLQHQIDRNEAVAQADKETRRAEMTAMKSDLAESLADFKTAIARSEAKAAEDRVEAAKERAEERARHDVAIEKLRTDMERNAKWQTAFIVAAIAVAVGILALWLQILLRPGG